MLQVVLIMFIFTLKYKNIHTHTPLYNKDILRNQSLENAFIGLSSLPSAGTATVFWAQKCALAFSLCPGNYKWSSAFVQFSWLFFFKWREIEGSSASFSPKRRNILYSKTDLGWEKVAFSSQCTWERWGGGGGEGVIHQIRAVATTIKTVQYQSKSRRPPFSKLFSRENMLFPPSPRAFMCSLKSPKGQLV